MWLKSETGATHALQVDLRGRTHFYASHPFDATPQIPELMQAGRRMFMVDCTLLSEEETKAYVTHTRHAISAYKAHTRPSARMRGHTSSRLFDEIG